MSNATNERYFDYRTASHFVAQGVITQAEFDAWLEKQEDCAALGTETEARMESSAQDEEQ